MLYGMIRNLGFQQGVTTLQHCYDIVLSCYNPVLACIVALYL